MHALQHGDPTVDVVVERDVVLAVMGAEETADVLDYPALEREGEGKEEGVELGSVEAFAEI